MTRDEVRELMEEVLDSDKQGVRIAMMTRGYAYRAWMQCNNVRHADRELMLRVGIGEKDPGEFTEREKRLMSKSEFDQLKFSYDEREGQWFLTIEKKGKLSFEVEWL